MSQDVSGTSETGEDHLFRLKPLDELLSLATWGFKQPQENSTDDELDRLTGDEISELLDEIARVTKTKGNGEGRQYVLPTAKISPETSYSDSPAIEPLHTKNNEEKDKNELLAPACSSPERSDPVDLNEQIPKPELLENDCKKSENESQVESETNPDLKDLSEFDDTDSDDDVESLIQSSYRNFTTDSNETSNSHILPLSSILEDEDGDEGFISEQIKLGRKERGDLKGKRIETDDDVQDQENINEAANEAKEDVCEDITDYPNSDPETSIAESIDDLLLNQSINSMDNSFGESSLILIDKCLINPVQEDLKLDPDIKELRILRKSTITSSPVEEQKKVIYKSSEWLKLDEKHLFGKFDEQSAERANHVNQKEIYLSNATSDPVAILETYSEPQVQRILYLNYKLNSAIAMKNYVEVIAFLALAESKTLNLKEIQIKLFTCEQNAKFAFAKLHTLGPLYDKITVLGLFQLEHSKSWSNLDYATIETALSNYKLPSNTEKLVIANGFNLDEGLLLPASLKFAAFYDCSSINLSKFNVTKNLEKLHVQSQDKELNIIKFGRAEKYPVGFSGLKEIKFSSQIVLYPNLESISSLLSLTLSDLDFRTTRNLCLPPMLRSLVFENCLISSHLVTFPHSLKRLVVRGGKWKEQRIITYVRLKELVFERADISDLARKVNKPRDLTSLTIRDCQLLSLKALKFAKTLCHIDLSFNKLTEVSDVQFPSGLQTLKLNNNKLQNWNVHTPESLVELNLSNNNLEGDIRLGNMKIIDISNNPLNLIEYGKSVQVLNLSGTYIGMNSLKIIQSGLKQLSINDCNIPEVKLNIPSSIEKLELRNCQVNVLDLQFEEHGSKLEYIDISHNNLTNFNDSLQNCQNLKEIKLDHNQLETFQLISQPLKLHLANNLIKSFSTTVPLTTLDLLNNSLDDPMSLALPETLDTLHLDGNTLSTISHEFQIPRKLQYLSLQHCHISSLDIYIPNSMETLNLRNNKLHSKSFLLKSTDSPLLNLLDLSENFFKDFNFDSLQDIQLAQLKLDNNMFDDIPPTIPQTILCAVFNSSSDSIVHNFTS